MNNLNPDLNFVRERYSTAADEFKPHQIERLIISEAPPENLERYFYFTDVKRQDSLFLEIMGVLYPEQKKRYLSSGRESILKENLLAAFQEDGFWLIDLCEIPCGLLATDLDEQIPALIERLKKHIDKTTPVILIKASVYDTCYNALVSKGYNVINERIPFPGSGQQNVFRKKFITVLAGLNS